MVEMSLQISNIRRAVKNDDFPVRTAQNEKEIIQTSSFDTLKPCKTETQNSVLSHYVLMKDVT